MIAKKPNLQLRVQLRNNQIMNTVFPFQYFLYKKIPPFQVVKIVFFMKFA